MNDKFKRMISADHFSEAQENDSWNYSAFSDDIPDIKFATDCFVSMVGGEFDFYGMDLDGVKLNDMIFKILEDPDDGYRSHLGAVRIFGDDEDEFNFFHTPIARVILGTSDQYEFSPEVPDDFNGYVLVDTIDSHIWALIGTGNTQDYYPFFVCRYSPKEKLNNTYS